MHVARTWPDTNLHLVTATGNGRCLLFCDTADRDLFLDLLDESVERFAWELYAWCLLGNHVHLVVRARPEELWKGMQRLKSVYAIRFHRRHHTSGHLFKRPYDSRPIVTEQQLHRRCSYTLRNPVRHGFVERAEDWEWSSFRTAAALAPPPRRSLHCRPFLDLLGLAGSGDRLAVMRGYVYESAGAMVAA